MKFQAKQPARVIPLDKLARAVQAGKDAGADRGQVANFIGAEYVPNLKAWEFHVSARACDREDGPLGILIGGSRGGSKTHTVFAQVALDDCQRVPGLKVLFLRKVQKSAAESFEDLTARVLRKVAHESIKNPARVTFPNGSRILIGGYSRPADIDKYLGVEYDLIVIEEATQIPEERHKMIQGSLRSSKIGWRARMYLTTNPGGIGHTYIKHLYVLPKIRGIPSRYLFIPMGYRDNPWLHREYIEYLEGLTGNLAKAWREGDWDIFEGQAFPNFDPELHVISATSMLQMLEDGWMRKRAIDWGLAAPFCCLWGAFPGLPWPRVLVYRELYQSGLTVPKQAELIRIFTPPNERVIFTYADPAMWGKKTYEDIVTSTADEYLKYGVPLTPADNARLSGKRKIDSLFEIQPDGLPGLLIAENCENLVRTLPELVTKENEPEDVDTKQEDHAYDTLRYLMTSTIGATLEPGKKFIRMRHPLSDLPKG